MYVYLRKCEVIFTEAVSLCGHTTVWKVLAVQCSGGVADFSLSKRCVVVSHCFNLHSSDGPCFHVLICCLYIFFDEMSVKDLPIL